MATTTVSESVSQPHNIMGHEAQKDFIVILND